MECSQAPPSFLAYNVEHIKEPRLVKHNQISFIVITKISVIKVMTYIAVLVTIGFYTCYNGVTSDKAL